MVPSRASASGSASIASSTSSVSSARATKCTVSPSIPSTSTATTVSHCFCRGTPWTPVSIQPGGAGSWSGSSVRPPSSASRSWSGLLRRKSPKLRRFDQAVPAVVAAVHDVDLVRLLVAEDEEVVADELELVDRLLRAHRVQRELLRLHDHRPALLVRLRVRACLGGAVAVTAVPVVRISVPAVLPLLAVARDLPLELVHQQVDRRAHVARGFLRAQHRTFRPDRRLRDMVRGDRGILLDGELELDARRIGELPIETAELLLRVGPDRLAHLDVLALHLQAHLGPPWEGFSCPESSRSHPRTARANVTTSTEEAPAARSAEAAAPTVEPVV